MSLRVLHVLDHSVPLHSGYAFRTLSILREQRKLGWETLHVTTPKQGESAAQEEMFEGFRFLRTPPTPQAGALGQMLATARRLSAAIEEFKPHLIHAHSPLLTVFPSLYAGRRYGLPVVYEVRATWEDAAVDHGSTTVGSLRYRLSKSLETFALRRVQHVTTICEGLRGEIVSRGIPQTRVTVIPNSVDPERFEFAGSPDVEIRRQLGFEGTTTIGFIGSFYGYEGLDYLLRAIPGLVDAGIDVRAVLVGGGPEESALRRLAGELAIEDRVHFAGRVSQCEVQKYYRAIDVLVYPRKRTRLTDLVTPLKPLEAMAQGNLVVASDVGGHRELIRDGETGVLFPADDVAALVRAVVELLRSRGSWSVLRKQAREFVTRERTWERGVSFYKNVYRACLVDHGGEADPPGT